MKYDNNYSRSGRVSDARRYKHLAFIHYGVDDAELTMPQFRVYCHLIRRAGLDDYAFPGIDSVAKTCRMSKTTAIKAVRSLEKLGMIWAQRKKGERSVYYISDEKDWLNPPKVAVHSRERCCSDEVTPPYHSRERKIHHKDTPLKDRRGFSIEKQEEDEIPF